VIIHVKCRQFLYTFKQTSYFCFRNVESYPMKRIIFSLFIAVLNINTAIAAQGSVDAGKGKAAMCAACHGANGIGASDAYPNLAGQHADYIVKQLAAFKAGTRKDPVMAPMAAGLSEQDMADIAVYFASLDRSGNKTASAGDSTNGTAATPAPVAFVANASAGKNLYEFGDTSRSIGACIGCHGKDGNSTVLIYPNLAKQHAQYIEKQLHAFKDETRTNNFAMMQFASSMSNEDIANIGAYLADTKALANVKAKPLVAAVPVSAAAHAGEAKAAMCASCHGADGNSPIAIYPKLAGQSETYLTKQLLDFKSGSREDSVMAGMVAALSEQDIQELAAYFASKKPTLGAGSTSEEGKKLYYSGDAKRGITACIACHGIKGKGIPKAGFPAVANQNADYLISQLTKFKSGARANDRNSMMANITKKMKAHDIKALAQFMATMK